MISLPATVAIAIASAVSTVKMSATRASVCRMVRMLKPTITTLPGLRPGPASTR